MRAIAVIVEVGRDLDRERHAPPVPVREPAALARRVRAAVQSSCVARPATRADSCVFGEEMLTAT